MFSKLSLVKFYLVENCTDNFKGKCWPDTLVNKMLDKVSACRTQNTHKSVPAEHPHITPCRKPTKYCLQRNPTPQLAVEPHIMKSRTHPHQCLQNNPTPLLANHPHVVPCKSSPLTINDFPKVKALHKLIETDKKNIVFFSRLSVS